MAVNSNDRYEAAVLVRWLRQCQDDEADQCYKCPFDGSKCLSHLRESAADLLEKFAADNKALQETVSQPTAEMCITWLRKCSLANRVNGMCSQCPFDDGVHNCMDWLHKQSADYLERLAAESKRTDCHSPYGTSQ